MANHTSIFVWRIPWTEEPGRLQSMGSQRVRLDWATNSFLHIYSSFLSWVKPWVTSQFQPFRTSSGPFLLHREDTPCWYPCSLLCDSMEPSPTPVVSEIPASCELLVGCPPVPNPRKSLWLDGSLPVSATGTSRPPGLWSQETHHQLHPVC